MTIHKIETTFKCDICGADGIGWKRRSYNVVFNGYKFKIPVAEPRTNMCSHCFETVELEDIECSYDDLDDYGKDWCRVGPTGPKGGPIGPSDKGI